MNTQKLPAKDQSFVGWFNFRTPDDWPLWKRRFEQFRVASGLANDDAVKQVNTLLYCIGEEAEAVLTSANATEAERKVYATILAKFDAFFTVRRNVIFERARFNRRSQLEGESAEKFIMELYTLAENCAYGDMTDEVIRDRLVVGIRDATLSQQLQLTADLTLETAKKRIRQREAVAEQQVLTGTAVGANSLDGVHPRRVQRSKRQPRPAAASARPKAKAPTTGKMCTRCGKGQHPRDKCPAMDAICHRCQRKGHYSSQCFSKQVSEVAGENHLETAFLDTVSVNQTSSWHARIRLNACETNFKLDTGAEVTAISEQTYKRLKKPQLTTTSKILHGPSQQPLKTISQFWGTFSHKKEVKQLTFVVDGLKTNLPAITALGLAVRVDTTTEAKTEIQRQYPSIFQGLGNLGEEYEICLNLGAVPCSLLTPRHVPLPLCPKVQEELNRMESIGVISKVDEPTPWCASMVVVPKNDGVIRICVDLKPLNESVLREVHPLPKVDETLAQLSGAKVFSKLDANSGFWQIPLLKITTTHYLHYPFQAILQHC